MEMANIGLLLSENSSMSGILPTLEDVLLHVMNLVILTVGLYFLLFKTIKKKIVARQEAMKKIEQENLQLNDEVKNMKVEFNQLIDKAKCEASKIHQDAVDVANKKSSEIISEAREKSRNIIERTEKEMVTEKSKLESEIKEEIAIISVDIAKKILDKEINAADNEKLIEDCLKNWSKND